MSAKLSVWLTLGLLGGWADPCQADAVAAKDFAYGLPLSPGHTGASAAEARPAMHVHTLSEAVLRTARDAELGDLCVFDASGVQRPMALRVPRAEPATLATAQLVYYPLQAPANPAGSGSEVRFERDSAGSVLHVFSRSLAAQDALLSVLIESRNDAITQLRLALSGPRNFTLEARVEASDDLEDFQEVARANVVRLEHGANTLCQEVVSLPATTARYLRLTLTAPAGLSLDSATALTLDSVSAELQVPGQGPPHSSVALTAVDTMSEATQSFRYTLPGVFRVDGWTLDLPRSTELAEATLLSTANDKAAYRVLDRNVFSGKQGPRDITPTDDDFFELQVGDKGGGIRAGAPTLQLRYLQTQLLFAGNDAEPYLLAYGSATARCKRFDEAELKSLVKQDAPNVAGADTVQAGARQTLAGEAALVRPTPPRPLRLYALWAILIAGVAALAVVTRKLLRNQPL